MVVGLLFRAVPVLVMAFVMVQASIQSQRLEYRSLLQTKRQVLTQTKRHVHHSKAHLKKVLATVTKMLPPHILRTGALKRKLASALTVEPSLFKEFEERDLDEKPWTSAIWRDIVHPKFFAQAASTAWDYDPTLKVSFTENVANSTSLCSPPAWVRNRTILWIDVEEEVRPTDLERLGWHQPYASIRSSYVPSFNVCTRPLTFPGARSLMFFPGVDDGSEHDCDILPMLMEAVGQKANVPEAAKGVAVDVGASEGMCTLLLLSKGYTVYSYEPAPIYQAWRQMSVGANVGFVNRVMLRGGLGGETTLDSELLEAADAPSRVHLLKIDADDVEASILLGGRSLLQSGQVEMVQLELWKSDDSGPCSEKECVVSSANRKAGILARLASHGYHIYVLRAWGNSAHLQVFADEGHECYTLSKKMHQYKDFQEGGSLGSHYQYGDHKVQALGLIHISHLAEFPRHKSSKNLKRVLVDCFTQFLGIHKSSPSLERLHAGSLHFLHEDNAAERLHL
jgi:hypothetical protein